LAQVSTGAARPNPTLTVDDSRLQVASQADGDWITFGRDYTNQRFAPFFAIDRSNVAQLVPAWAYELGTIGAAHRAHETGFEEGRLVFCRNKMAYGRLVGLMAHVCLHVF